MSTDSHSNWTDRKQKIHEKDVTGKNFGTGGLHVSTQTLGHETRPGTRTGSDPRFIWSIESGSGPILLPWVLGLFNIMCDTQVDLR